MKKEALKLADILEGAEVPNDTQMFEASAMIRRLVEELDKQKFLLNEAHGVITILGDERDRLISKPSDDEILDLSDSFSADSETSVLYEFTASGLISLIREIQRTNYTTPQTKPTITRLDGKVVAVTMTDDEHRITEVLWEAPKPLSDEEILAIADKFIERFEYEPCNVDEIGFARAIEERHGIK